MKIIFRADGDKSTGLGHIMRSAALMQILQLHFTCEFHTKNPEYFPLSEFANPPIIKELFFSDILEEGKQLAAEAKDAIIVLDGYQFTTLYQQNIKKTNLKLVCIDDIISYHFIADAVINHAGGIDASAYSKEAYTKLFLGPDYALIKPLFYQMPQICRDIKDRKLLISLGGADINNDTDKILNELLQEAYFTELHVIMGAANPHFGKIKKKFNKPAIKFYRSLAAKDVRDLMQLCSFAVLPPSTICYEYMSVGGMVFLYQTADNQKYIYRYFLDKAIAFPFENIGKIKAEDLVASMQQQQKIFDGKSPERLFHLFASLSAAAN